MAGTSGKGELRHRWTHLRRLVEFRSTIILLNLYIIYALLIILRIQREHWANLANPETEKEE